MTSLGRDIKFVYLGQATFRIETPGGKKMLIDPWVMNNPMCPDNLKQVDDLEIVLITHGHSDHFQDGVEVLQKSGALAIGANELCAWLGSKGIENLSPMNKGGTQEWEGIKITAVHADHSSGIQDGNTMVYSGEPLGYVVEFENGFKLYHAGDTAVFSDMKLIADLYKPDLAMLPIGDHYTMGPEGAALATKFLNVKQVVPMHYATLPELTGTPEQFKEAAADIQGLQVYDIKPGETLE